MKLLTLSDYIDDAAFCRRRTLIIASKLRMWWPLPIAAMLDSSCAVVFGWPVYGAGAPRWVKHASRALHRISDARYWVKYRIAPTRYHWVDTGLPPGYYDPDQLMLHSAMACLGRYIAAMGGLNQIAEFNADLRDPNKQDRNAPEGSEDFQADRQDAAADIWRWWTVQRPADEACRNALCMRLFGGDRVSFQPTDNPRLSEMVVKPFEGTEKDLHAEFRALERKIDEDEQRMLHRLVDIRRSLWT